MERIYYTCKNCGWKDSIIELWSDLKPLKCPNRKCGTNFRKNPELLETKSPKKKEEKVTEIKSKSKKKSKKKEKSHGKTLEQKDKTKQGEDSLLDRETEAEETSVQTQESSS